MNHVSQKPNFCNFACLESVLIDKGNKLQNQEGLADIGGPRSSMLEAMPRINSSGFLSIRQTNTFFEGKEVDTLQLLSMVPPGESLIVILYRKESKAPLGNIGTTHAIRLEALGKQVLVMDPFMDNENPNGAFDNSNRRGDNLILTDCETINKMRREHDDANFPESFYVK